MHAEIVHRGRLSDMLIREVLVHVATSCQILLVLLPLVTVIVRIGPLPLDSQLLRILVLTYIQTLARGW